MRRKLISDAERQMEALHDREARFRASQGAKHRPLIEVREHGSAYNVPTATGVNMKWGMRHEEMSYGSGFEVTSNEEKIYVPEFGLWTISAYVVWSTNSSGYRQVGIQTDLNGGLIVDRRAPSPSNQTHIGLSVSALLTPDDGVWVQISQTSGSTLTIDTESHFYIARIT